MDVGASDRALSRHPRRPTAQRGRAECPQRARHAVAGRHNKVPTTERNLAIPWNRRDFRFRSRSPLSGLPAVDEPGQVRCPPTSVSLGPVEAVIRLTRKPCMCRVSPGCRYERGY
jgi:hypothetical protein